MKKIVYLLIIVLSIAAFKTSAVHAQKNNQDKNLSELIKKLEQEPGNKKVPKSLVNFYNDAQQLHLQNIKDVEDNSDQIPYQKILEQYTILQNMFETIEHSEAARQLVSAPNYEAAIANIKLRGAEENYRQGTTFFTANGRVNKTKAYNAFKNALQFKDDYKDSKLKMAEAWKSSRRNILINPIKDSSSLVENVYSVEGDNKSVNKKFQQYIAGDLTEKYAAKYNAEFYTQQNNTNENTQADWTVDITVIDVNVPAPTIFIASKDVTTSEITGKDSVGNPIYTTKYGTIDNETTSYSATGKIKVTITEVSTGKTISSDRLKVLYTWGKGTKTGLGDRKTLLNAGYDPSSIPQTGYFLTTNEVILSLVYQKSYPEIQKIIADAISK